MDAGRCHADALRSPAVTPLTVALGGDGSNHDPKGKPPPARGPSPTVGWLPYLTPGIVSAAGRHVQEPSEAGACTPLSHSILSVRGGETLELEAITRGGSHDVRIGVPATRCSGSSISAPTPTSPSPSSRGSSRTRIRPPAPESARTGEAAGHMRGSWSGASGWRSTVGIQPRTVQHPCGSQVAQVGQRAQVTCISLPDLRVASQPELRPRVRDRQLPRWSRGTSA
jgi:hypothetical protein